MRFPYRFTGKGSAEQRVEKNHGLTKQHIQSFEASCYAFLYIVGIQSVRILKRLRRRTHRFFLPATNLIKRVYAKTLGRQFARLRKELHSIREGFTIAGKRLRDAKQQSVGQALKESVKVTGKSFVRHKKFVCGILNIAAPLGALVLLIFTIQYWNSLNYGLVLTYDGQEIATIQDENIFEQATEMVNQRMIHDVEGEDTQVEITPSFKLSVVDENRYSAASAVCDLIIKQSDGIIEEASGLYVDGELIGAVKSSADLRYILQNILNAAKEGDTDAEAAFAQNVETVSGLFPTNSIMTTEEMESLLTGTEKDAVLYTVKAGDTATSIAQDHNLTLTELASINQFSDIDVLHEGDLLNIEMAVPKLSVNIMKNQEYDVDIPYKTITQKDDSQYTDYSKVITAGVNGRQHCVDQVTYLNGVEVKRENLSTTVLEEPVDQVVVTGTKKRPKTAEAGVSTGSMMWPVPSLHTITTGFEYRWGSFHSGIDISGSSAYGKTIVAADGGTVTAAGYSGSYGLRVQINHGNGLQTLYGHRSKLLVSPGQKVAKGQAIALVGSTGNSTGPHCHFEVYKNGSRVNPFNYVN